MTVNFPIQRSDAALDLTTIAPMRGGIYQLHGHGRAGQSMRKYAEAWTVAALMRGESVHWVDGASRIDPSRILKCFPSHEPSARDHLHRLFIGRGFTVHQLATLVERLPREVSITRSPLVVIDGPIAMHLDTQVGDHEARSLMRSISIQLQDLAEKNNTAVIVITATEPVSKRHQHLLAMIERRSSQHLSEQRIAKTDRSPRWLIHQPSGTSGMWPEPRVEKSLFRVFDQLTDAGLH